MRGHEHVSWVGISQRRGEGIEFRDGGGAQFVAARCEVGLLNGIEQLQGFRRRLLRKRNCCRDQAFHRGGGGWGRGAARSVFGGASPAGSWVQARVPPTSRQQFGGSALCAHPTACPAMSRRPAPSSRLCRCWRSTFTVCLPRRRPAAARCARCPPRCAAGSGTLWPSTAL